MGRVFSGVQPTGNIHIGNYLGAFRQFPGLQDDNDCVYCIVDLHSITLPQDPKELKGHILDIAAFFLAVGIDPKRSIVFVQSDVAAHAELSWMLMCNSYTGELSRMTQFKQKNKDNESAPAGLFTYPILMAADILLYNTTIVPVGNDQKQHIELTRDIAIRVNNAYGETFVVPEGRFLKEGARVMSLDDPTAKMSKSAPNEHSRISLLDDYAKVKKSIMRATTDSDGNIKYDIKEKAGISNLLTIYSAFSGVSIKDLEKQYEGKGYGAFKKDLVDVVWQGIEPVSKKFNEIRYSQELIDTLKDGARRADEIAQTTIRRVKDNLGLGT